MVLTKESILAQWCQACRYKNEPEVCDECRNGSRFKEPSDDMIDGKGSVQRKTVAVCHDALDGTAHR